MACPSFLRRKLTYGIGNKILAPSGGVVYPPSDIQYYYEFNGVDSHVALPEITIGGPSRRLSFTVNTTQTGADWALIASTAFDGYEGHVLVYVDNPDGLQLLVGTTSGFSRHVFGEQAAICNGEDNTVSLGYEEGVVTAYLNGAPIGPPAAVDQVDWYLSGVVDGAVNLFGGSGARYLSGVAKNANFQGTLTANGQTYSELNYPIIFDNIGDTIVRETVNGDAALDGQLINAQDADYIEV